MMDYFIDVLLRFWALKVVVVLLWMLSMQGQKALSSKISWFVFQQ